MINKIVDLLDLKLKIRLILLIFLIFFRSLLELLSISSIPFLIIYLLRPEKIVFFLKNYNLEFLSIFADNLNLQNVLFIIISIFLIKNIIFFFINVFENKIHYQVNIKYRLNLFNYYLDLNYLDLIKTNISLIIRNITIEATHFSSAITNLIKLAQEAIMILVFFIFIIYISDIKAVLIFLTFSVIGGLVFIILKKQLKSKGQIAVEARGKVVNNVYDTFNLIKDILINNLQFYFTKSFYKNLDRSEKIDLFSNIVFSSTKLLFELFGVMLICLLIYLNADQSNSDELLAYLSVISVTIIRMLPSFNTILSEANKLQFRFGSIDLMHNILKKSENSNYNIENTSKIEIKKLDFKNKINIKNLNSKILDEEIIEEISVTIDKGSKIALVGSSGSGKTTFINHLCLLYLTKPNTIFCDEVEISSKSQEWKKIISHMPQENIILNDTILKNIALGFEKSEIDKNKIKKVMDISCCDEFINKLPEKEDTILGKNGLKLSGGQMQRICIARSLYKDFDILFMDEPTNSLDKINEENIINNIISNYKDKTIFVSVHKLELINKFDFVMLLGDKKLLGYYKSNEIHNNDKIFKQLEEIKLKNEKIKSNI